jgi:hypothetical protein
MSSPSEPDDTPSISAIAFLQTLRLKKELEEDMKEKELR